MKSENLLTILLGILVLVSAVQAYQLVSINDALSSGTVSVGAPSAQYSSGTQSPASGSSASSSLQNAPNMVGGC